MTHEILEWANVASSTMWLVFVIAFILWTEYWHRIRGVMVTAFTPGLLGVIPSTFLVLAVMSASTTAITRILLVWW